MRIVFLTALLIILSTTLRSQRTTTERLELKRLALENKYRTVWPFDPLTGLAPVYNDGYMGYIDTSGKIILPIAYWTHPFNEGLGFWRDKGSFKVIDKTGKIVKEYPDMSSFVKYDRGYAVVSTKTNGDGKYGVMDMQGNFIIKCNYEYIERISEKYYKVNNNKTGQGIVNNKGDTIIPLRFTIDYIDTTTLRFIGYTPEAGHAIFNRDGSVVKSLGKTIYIESSAIEGQHYYERDGVLIVKDKFSDPGARYALVNLNFDTIVPLGKYRHLSDINEGLIKFSDSVTTNEFGQRTSPYQYVKCGFLDTKGKVAIPANFDFAQYFTEGLSAVRKNNKWGYINNQGKVVIPLQFDYALPFRNGFAKVQVKDKFFIIDKTGKKVLDSKPY